MKNIQLAFLSIILLSLFTGCSSISIQPKFDKPTNTLIIPFTNKCSYVIKNASLLSEKSGTSGDAPIITYSRKQYTADFPCRTLNFQKQNITGNFYWLNTYSEDLKANVNSCVTETISGVDFTICGDKRYISTEDKKGSGYDNRKIIFTHNACFYEIKEQLKSCVSGKPAKKYVSKFKFEPKTIEKKFKNYDFNNHIIATNDTYFVPYKDFFNNYAYMDDKIVFHNQSKKRYQVIKEFQKGVDISLNEQYKEYDRSFALTSLEKNTIGFYSGTAQSQENFSKCGNAEISYLSIKRNKLSGLLYTSHGREIHLEGTIDGSNIKGTMYKDITSSTIGNFEGSVNKNQITGSWSDLQCKGTFTLTKKYGY